jgi:hypothetical protein
MDRTRKCDKKPDEQTDGAHFYIPIFIRKGEDKNELLKENQRL